MKKLIAALALMTLPAIAQAQAAPQAPKKEDGCTCCKMMEGEKKMDCCEKNTQGAHDTHNMQGMDHSKHDMKK